MPFTVLPLGDLYNGRIVDLVVTLEVNPSYIDKVSVELHAIDGNSIPVPDTTAHKLSPTRLEVAFQGLTAENLSVFVRHDLPHEITVNSEIDTLRSTKLPGRRAGIEGRTHFRIPAPGTFCHTERRSSRAPPLCSARGVDGLQDQAASAVE